jgi:peptidoglycan hydrolase CwlO-like protein
MLIQQKCLTDSLKNELNRDLEKKYASDLSVTSFERDNVNKDELEFELQESRRERDRLNHENFALQSDVDGLEADKERVLDEIDENEEHLEELKSKFNQLSPYSNCE